jgi:hypothetical protein
LRRELSDEDVGYQAMALMSYVSRGGSGAQWWRSKDFYPADRRAIEARVLAMAGGDKREEESK